MTAAIMVFNTTFIDGALCSISNIRYYVSKYKFFFYFIPQTHDTKLNDIVMFL